jgi:hypothetical protein
MSIETQLRIGQINGEADFNVALGQHDALGCEDTTNITETLFAFCRTSGIGGYPEERRYYIDIRQDYSCLCPYNQLNQIGLYSNSTPYEFSLCTCRVYSA